MKWSGNVSQGSGEEEVIISMTLICTLTRDGASNPWTLKRFSPKLLMEDEDLEAQDETGCTPLLNACYVGYTRSFNLPLLRQDANVHAVNTEGWDAIHQIHYRINYYGEQYGDCAIVPRYERFLAEGILDLLLSSSCSPTIAPKNGNMPFPLICGARESKGDG